MPQKTKIQIRRGASTQWCSVNPVLSAGEPALETDTNKFKIGDGTLTWNQLPYVGFDGGDLDVEEVSQLGTFTSGSTQITLSSLFDTNQSVRSYKGLTGAALTVPAGYDFAVYIDSNGNVTQQSVTAGQVIYFRSEILLGNEFRRMTCNVDQGCIDDENGEYDSKAGCDASCARGYRCLSDAGCKEVWSNLELMSKYTCEENCKKFWKCDPVTACQQNEVFSFDGMSEEKCEAECIPRNICDVNLGCRRYNATTSPWNIVESCEDCCFETYSESSFSPRKKSCDTNLICNGQFVNNLEACKCFPTEANCNSTCIGQPGFDFCGCPASHLTDEQKCFCNKPECPGAWCEGCNCMEGQRGLGFNSTFVPGGKCPGPDITFMPGEVKSQGGVRYCNTCEECEKCRHDGRCVPDTEKPGCGSSSSSSYTPLPMMGRNPMEIKW